MKTVTRNELVTVQAASAMIASGAALSVAGAETALDQLPRGRWVGGTIPYFMAADGGVKTAERVFVTHLPAEAEVRVASYAAETLKQIVVDAPENGFSFTIIPAGSGALQRFSEEGRFWEDVFLKPLVGWIAGVDVEQIGRQTAKVYNGATGAKLTDGAVVLHVTLPGGRLAAIETVNIFEPDTSATIRFAQTGSTVGDCLVNGHPTRLADFLVERGNIDGRLPLVGDFAGARLNVSFQSIDRATGRVALYAPVFPDVEYHLAKPVADYAARFAEELQARAGADVLFSCNCILNYLYGQLEGKRTGALQGPVTFGEIAYLLHNQTMVVLTIH